MQYTHGHHHSVLRSHGWRTAENSAAHLLPHLRPTTRLLDVGAGVGTITVDLASRVAHVTATEVGEQELDLSRKLAAEQGLSNLDFAIEDVHRLSFADAQFDVTHAHQVLQHVADPVQALREMKRVTRPGGIVAVRDSDYAGFIWWPEIPELDEWLALYLQVARANGGEPNAGRRLLNWANQVGFREVIATSSTWCYATAHERDLWGLSWAERITKSAFAQQSIDHGLATRADQDRIAAGWRRWAAADDGWFSLVHGEILCWV